MKLLFYLRELFLSLTIPSSFLFGLFIIWKTQNLSNFEKTGLFNIQNPPIIILILIFSLLIIFLGLLLWTSAYFYLGKSFSILPKAQKLITNGPYRFFQHPIYTGIFLTFLGLSLASNSIPGTLYTLLCLGPINLTRAKKEEKELKKIFGKKYLIYKQKTYL